MINQTTHRIAMSVKRISYRRPWDVLYDDENDTEDILHVYAKNNGDRITKREMKKNKNTSRNSRFSLIFDVSSNVPISVSQSSNGRCGDVFLTGQYRCRVGW